MRQLKSNRVLLTVVFAAVIFCVFSSWMQSTTNTFAQDKTFQLNADQVLAIIARPLPDSTERGFYLPNVDLHNTNLIGANFSSAILTYSDLSGAFLLNANFSGASLQEVNLREAELSDADLSNAWLLASNLTGATISYSILDNANLEDANLTDADLTASSLKGANLTGAIITDALFTGAIMEGVRLPNGQLYKEGDDLVTRFGTASNP